MASILAMEMDCHYLEMDSYKGDKMTLEEGCWNCRYAEVEADQEPCDTCDLHDLRFKKWERGEQVRILQSSASEPTG